MQTATGIILPDGYDRVKVAGSLKDMFAIPLDANTDCILCERALPDIVINAESIVRVFNQHAMWHSYPQDEIIKAMGHVNDEAANAALHFILADIHALQNHCADIDPRLDIEIPTLDPELRIATHEWHYDGQPESDAFKELVICNYAGKPTQGARHSDTRPKVNGIGENEYEVKEGSPIIEFGHFNFWRFKTQYRDMMGHAFIHRAPPPKPGDAVRALIVASRKQAFPGQNP